MSNNMTLEYLAEQKLAYQNKQTYYKNIGFDRLASEFQGVITLITEMEDCIKEKENGQD